MYSFWTKSRMVICRNCGFEFEKSASQIKRSKNNFCTKSCGASWNNKNLKKVGVRRSKLEVALEEKIKKELPDIEVLFNNKDQIGSEIDIFFPKNNIAFEINGPAHYRPIWGEKKLKAVQTLDKQKFDLCQSLNIRLIVLDVSCEGFSKKNVEKHFQHILKELEISSPSATA